MPEEEEGEEDGDSIGADKPTLAGDTIKDEAHVDNVEEEEEEIFLPAEDAAKILVVLQQYVPSFPCPR